MTATEMSLRVGVSRPTIHRLEAGSLTVSIAVLVRVLEVLSLGDQLDLIARDDELGDALNDSRLSRPRRASGSNLADEL